MSNGWLQLAQEAIKVPGLLVEIYGDLARPGVKQVGRALETVIGLGNTVLWPVAWANERTRIALEKNLEKYRERMNAVPEEKTVGVAPEIGVPIAEKLAYVRDEKLSDLYVKLLATASNVETLGNAHPSFVNVINNLSPDEAHLLEYFVNRRDLPFVRATAARASDGSHNVLGGPLVPQDALEGLVFPGNIDSYLSNLDGLGLLVVKYDEWLVDDSLYEPLEAAHRETYTRFMQQAPSLQGRELKFGRGIVQRTSFGLQFMLACHGQ
ncbi:DUF4393 domain-containing protein [Ideonella sp. BN130291]|uniref:DUF4393 domain-containing protein n=1 Tax=Ideonella sp. BN130291 TaxID=3112940 RepID=UPI002E254BD2|nr:DUF4393 domain-containing protein [Ideonella sp. BN130291]